MDLDKKIHGFCKVELRKRFRLVFYPGKLSLAACSEQIRKTRAKPNGLPMRANGFSQFRSSSNDCDASTIQGRGALQPTVATQPRDSRLPWQNRLHRQSTPPLSDTRNTSPRLFSQGNIALKTKSGTGHPRSVSPTLQTFQPNDYFSKGDIVLMASRISYRSLIWSM